MAKQIELTQGKFSIIDDEDFDRVSQYKWAAHWSPGMNAYRAVRSENKKTIYLHRFILKAPEGLVVDHINRDMLDNRKENLRLATVSQNQQNRNSKSKNTTGYKGVSYYKPLGKYKAQIHKMGIAKHIGYYETAIEAAKAYDEKAKEIFGKFARTNF